jgi:hypothetical protein
MDEFCDDHYLGQEILGLLKQCRFESPRSLLVAEEPTLVAKRFKIGHIAELKWALKRMVGKELLMDDDNAAGVVVYGASSCCAAISSMMTLPRWYGRRRRIRGGTRWPGWLGWSGWTWWS